MVGEKLLDSIIEKANRGEAVDLSQEEFYELMKPSQNGYITNIQKALAGIFFFGVHESGVVDDANYVPSVPESGVVDDTNYVPSVPGNFYKPAVANMYNVALNLNDNTVVIENRSLVLANQTTNIYGKDSKYSVVVDGKEKVITWDKYVKLSNLVSETSGQRLIPYDEIINAANKILGVTTGFEPYSVTRRAINLQVQDKDKLTNVEVITKLLKNSCLSGDGLSSTLVDSKYRLATPADMQGMFDDSFYDFRKEGIITTLFKENAMEDVGRPTQDTEENLSEFYKFIKAHEKNAIFQEIKRLIDAGQFDDINQFTPILQSKINLYVNVEGIDKTMVQGYMIQYAKSVHELRETKKREELMKEFGLSGFKENASFEQIIKLINAVANKSNLTEFSQELRKRIDNLHGLFRHKASIMSLSPEFELQNMSAEVLSGIRARIESYVGNDDIAKIARKVVAKAQDVALSRVVAVAQEHSNKVVSETGIKPFPAESKQSLKEGGFYKNVLRLFKFLKSLWFLLIKNEGSSTKSNKGIRTNADTAFESVDKSPGTSVPSNGIIHTASTRSSFSGISTSTKPTSSKKSTSSTSSSPPPPPIR